MKTLILAVIGPKGCGKTSFIRSLFENAGDYVVAQDDDISIHTANLDEENLQIHLIDTPGLSPDKRHLPDTETINYIKSWLDSMDGQIDGVIYLQRVMDLSNANYAVRNLDALFNVFRSRRFRHAVVAATNWDRVTSETDSSVLEGYFFDHLERVCLVSSLGIRLQRARLSDSTDASWDLLEGIPYVETPELSPPPSPPPPTPASPSSSDVSWVPDGQGREGAPSVKTKHISIDYFLGMLFEPALDDEEIGADGRVEDKSPCSNEHAEAASM
ncbi:hypothetical protein BDP81DRAFT_389122 [Colletotrichum phormii]|uniref:G domain-containing protein n=1 Tax=Colletotrichum phormii TaxID=359342 RepID=A0AAJ0A4H1_9PEZI|nr:uncharacterized protein BDP81DRAFT_389122 [Colletotrichum phormii]KAK1656331.1 hypothetical protein BDP81DRAFT_389122 [Colletotrichum phormii]